MDQFQRDQTMTSTTRFQNRLGHLSRSGATASGDSRKSVSQNTRTCNKLRRVYPSTGRVG